LKKSTNSVRFQFYKPETKKTEPNPNKKKPSQTGKTESNRKNQAKTRQNWKNQAKPVWTGFCPKKPNWNRPIWTSFILIFFIKIKLNRKKSPLVHPIFHSWHVAAYSYLLKKNIFSQHTGLGLINIQGQPQK